MGRRWPGGRLHPAQADCGSGALFPIPFDSMYSNDWKLLERGWAGNEISCL